MVDDGSQSEESEAQVAPEATSTAARTSAPPEEVIRLEGIAAEQSATSETIRIQTSGGTPGYTVRYVEAVRVEGEPILVEGEAFLEVVLESADPQGSEGMSPDVTVSELVEQDLLREIRFARYVDGTVTYAVGLSEEAAFSVTADADGLIITFSR